MKKCLFIALAALGFVACEKDDENSGSNLSGELEQSYVAITLAASDLNTRATNGNSYEIGSPEERAVKSAYVFFFKDGAAFPVTFNASTETSSNAGQSNYLQINLSGNKEDMDNFSNVKDAVLVLQNYKGEYPNQIVAVLNWDPTEKKTYTLSELKTKVSKPGSDEKGYVMSNAVYADKSNQTIDAVSLTIDNICKNKADALKNPVTIHVERVAAKVVFTADNNGKFPVGEVKGQPVYAQIKGFELFNDAEESRLIKRIDTENWSDIGFNWNEHNWFRSYWAQSLGKNAFGDKNQFDWKNDNTDLNGFVYCGENTLAWTEANDVRTKVIVKAQLVNNAGDETIELVNWFGKDYVGEENLKKVVANTIYNTYFYSTVNEGVTKYTGLQYDDIKCVSRQVTDDNAYEVYFQLSDEDDKGIHKTWYKYEDGNYTEYTDNQSLNNELAAIQPALVYKNGMTYYYTNIKHLGAANSTAEYGVVRNHVYKVNINAITGYGTPVYNEETDFVTPEKPEDVTTYVSAQINILSWRLVDNTTGLK